jgi:hypothetical protein
LEKVVSLVPFLTVPSMLIGLRAKPKRHAMRRAC